MASICSLTVASPVRSLVGAGAQALGHSSTASAAATRIPSRCILPSKDLRVAVALRNVSCTKLVNGKKSSQRPLQVQAFMDIQNDPIVKEALKVYVWGSRSPSTSNLNVSKLNSVTLVLEEPVAFLGGVFAGLLRLDLNEEPLREWVAKTAEAAGIVTEEPESTSSNDGPKEIEIE